MRTLLLPSSFSLFLDVALSMDEPHFQYHSFPVERIKKNRLNSQMRGKKNRFKKKNKISTSFAHIFPIYKRLSLSPHNSKTPNAKKDCEPVQPWLFICLYFHRHGRHGNTIRVTISPRARATMKQRTLSTHWSWNNNGNTWCVYK